MKIFMYKRVHVGDPNLQSKRFGIHDCMKTFRNFKYDAVIGVGGMGAEPISFSIDKKITWIGITPTYTNSSTNNHVDVEFKYFLLLDEHGPLLNDIAPLLAKRFYDGGARFLLTGYSKDELLEAKKILEWSKKQEQPKFFSKKESIGN